jgi:hypothetical protein
MPTPGLPSKETMPIELVDPRGVRFAGALTALVAILSIAAQNPFVYGAAALVLLVGSLAGQRWNLWSWTFRLTIRPFLAPAPYGEPANPPRFAQFLGGTLFAASSALAFTGHAWIAIASAGVVAALALVNAVTGFCLGCRFYWLFVRGRVRARPING